MSFPLNVGDVCALFMENKIEYAPTWLGLSKIGVITALINTNLRNDPLVHSITIANSKFLIYGAELTECNLMIILFTLFFLNFVYTSC